MVSAGQLVKEAAPFGAVTERTSPAQVVAVVRRACLRRIDRAARVDPVADGRLDAPRSGVVRRLGRVVPGSGLCRMPSGLRDPRRLAERVVLRQGLDSRLPVAGRPRRK